MPASPASRTPLSKLAGTPPPVSWYTEPAIDAGISPKLLFGEPAGGKAVTVARLLLGVPLALPVA